MSALRPKADASAKADLDSDGQNKAVGHVLLALGAAGFLLGAVGLALDIHPELMDPRLMAASGLVMVVIGAWQRSRKAAP